MKRSLEYKIEHDNLFGCIKYKSDYSIYLMPIGWWILNYTANDPNHSNNPSYRNNIYNVTDDKIKGFINAIEDNRVSLGDLESVENVPLELLTLSFFIDFDSKLFINGYYDNVLIEKYMPDSTWIGEMGFPLNYIPNALKSYFTNPTV